MSKLFNMLFAKKKSPNLLGVSIQQDTISYGYFPQKGQSTNEQFSGLNDVTVGLEKLHEHKEISGRCQLILCPKTYQIVQVDQPNVPEEEMVAALQWLVKDLVTIPGDDLLLDYFSAPMVAGQQKLNVVCTQRSKVQPYVTALHKNNIALETITTEEFAFSHLLANKQGPQLLICQQPNAEIIILIVKEQQLFSFRRLRGTALIGQRTEQELSHGAIDNLSIEIQKSIDFFERQLKQPPVKTINVLLPTANEAFIARKLSENTHLAVELLKLPSEISEERGFAAVNGCIYAQLAPATTNENHVEKNVEAAS